MFTLLDLMRQAQGGQAIDNLAAAYGLKRRDLETLMGTLLPVFALGMKKSVADMASPASVADLIDPDKFRAAYDDTSAAMSPAATEAGRIALQKMFGSGDAADVIARQASAITGIGADVVSRVMPAMTATLFGGIAKELEATPLAPFLKGFSADPTAALGALGNPMKDAMGAFLKGYAEGKPGAEPAAAEGIRWPAGMEGFGKMFEAGMEMNEASRKAFEQILEGKK
jgi:hypothetical protein